MPNLFNVPNGWRWNPDADAVNAPAGSLLRADNLIYDEDVVVGLRAGSTKVYTGLENDVHSLYTAYLSSSRYRMTGAGDRAYINGVDIGIDFDGDDKIAFGSWLGQIFMARGKTRYKHDGTTLTLWGMDKPAAKPEAAPGAAPVFEISNMNQSETPAWSANEGTITGTYPDGHDGQPNGSLEVTPAAGTGRATITRTYDTEQDLSTIEGYSESDTDLVDLLVWLTKPEEVESITYIFGVGTSSNDPFKDDYYEYKFEIGGSATTAPSKEVQLRSTESVTSAVQERIVEQRAQSTTSSTATGTASSGEAPEEAAPPPAPEAVYDDFDRAGARLPSYKYDLVYASYNPGWVHFTVPRGSFTRFGFDGDRDWSTVKAVRIVYKAKAASTGTARFDVFQMRGGGERALTGDFRFLYQQVVGRQNTDREYIEMSPPSDPTEAVSFNTETVNITVPAKALRALDPQANQLWHYMTGGLLDDFYRVAVTGVDANDNTMAIDEFSKSADGFFSNPDRVRLVSWGLSTPGQFSVFEPSDVAGLQVWMDAGDLTLSDGGAVSYWPGKISAYSDFAPSDLSTLAVWLRADANVYSDAGTTPATGGDTVYRWGDSSGNGNYFEQTTAGNRPSYQTGIVNGKPVVRFDGLDDYLTCVNNDTSYITGGLRVVFIVYKADTLDTVASPAYSSGGLFATQTGGLSFSMTVTSNGNLYAHNNDGVTDESITSGITHTAWGIAIAGRGSSGTGILSASGVFTGHNNTHSTSLTVTSSGSTVNGAFPSALGVTYAGISPFDGDIAELIILNGQVSDEETIKIHRYLAAKYDLAMPDSQHDEASTAFGASQYASANQPVYKASVESFNNLPAVYFDGSNDQLMGDGDVDTVVTGSAKTIFVVAMADTIDAGGGASSVHNNTIFGWADEAGATPSAIMYHGSTGAYKSHITAYDGTQDHVGVFTVALDAPHIHTLFHDGGGTLYHGVNDTRDSAMNSVASGSTTIASLGPYRIGGNQGGISNEAFNGWIAEILVYNVAVTEEDRQRIESYLATKYGMETSLVYQPTSVFGVSGEPSDDLLLYLSADEVQARLANKKLNGTARRPPEDIIAILGPYAQRLWCLCSTGYLYPSLFGNPSSYEFTQAIKVGDSVEEPLWGATVTGGIYCGTRRDIVKVYGTAAEFPDKTLDVRRVNLNVADPPVDTMVCTDGNVLIYRSAKGFMLLVNDQIQPLPMDNIELLYRGKTRHGVSAINRSTGEFEACVSDGKVYIITPEGADTTKSTRIYVYDTGDNRWHRFVYPASFQCIWRERDGTVLAGDDSGNVWQIEVGTQDNGSDIAIVLWTPFDPAGSPLAFKDSFDLAVEADTGGNDLTCALHKDDSSSATDSHTINTSSVAWYRAAIASGFGAFRTAALRMSGSFSTFVLRTLNLSFRPRPQYRKHVDTGYIRTGREDLQWFRELQICIRADSNLTVTPYFDDVAFTAKTVTTTAGVVKVYTVPLGREYKGSSPRVVFEAVGADGTDYNGFELYWMKFRHRRSGDDSKLDLRVAFTDFADAVVGKAGSEEKK